MATELGSQEDLVLQSPNSAAEDKRLRQQSDESGDDDAMWAGVEDAATGASLQHDWDDLNVDDGDAVGVDAGRGRESGFADMSTPAPDGGGLRLDVQAWEKGMGDIISQVGMNRPSPAPPIAERLTDAENRLRILEEDRDILHSQSVKLQSMLDSEREDRQIAQKSQAAAVEKLRALDEREGEVHCRDANRLQELEATASLVRQKLEKARRNIQAPAADVVDSLKQRTQYLEEISVNKDRQNLQWQREMGKKLALTLKVLQLQKEHAAQVEEVQDKLHRMVSQAAAEASHARNRSHDSQELVAALFRRTELIYSEETRRERDLSHTKGQVELLLRKVREKTTTLREYENGLAEDLKTSEYERRLHDQLVHEYEVCFLAILISRFLATHIFLVYSLSLFLSFSAAVIMSCARFFPRSLSARKLCLSLTYGGRDRWRRSPEAVSKSLSLAPFRHIGITWAVER